jgi:excisionase family DNA binding protein
MAEDWRSPASMYPVSHVADMLAVSPSTVYRLVRQGELPAVKRGRHLRVVRADLVAWLDRRERESKIRGWFAPGRPIRVLTGGRAEG